MAAGTSTLSNMFVPEVVGDLVRQKLFDLIKFLPLCKVDETLVGQPGNKITLPRFTYIGDAEAVLEGGDIPIAQLVADTDDVTIAKVGKGVEFTDEALLSGYGDPQGEAVDQIAKSIASKVDNDVLTLLGTVTAPMVLAYEKLTDGDGLAAALVKFGEDIEGTKVALVSPEAYAEIRKTSGWLPASEIAANMLVQGAVGEAHGCQIVMSNKLTAAKKAFIVKPGALALYLKRDTLIETDRDIIAKKTVLTADKHLALHLYDASKVIMIDEAVVEG